MLIAVEVVFEEVVAEEAGFGLLCPAREEPMAEEGMLVAVEAMGCCLDKELVAFVSV